MQPAAVAVRRVAMNEFYPQILAAHVGAVTLSGALFAVRGAAVLAGVRHAMAAPVRYLSYTIDTVLLAAALVLVTILPAAAFANHWLGVKLVLVAAYIVLGVFALRRGRSPRTRAACYALALLAFAAIVGIARSHDPMGWLSWFAH